MRPTSIPRSAPCAGAGCASPASRRQVLEALYAADAPLTAEELAAAPRRRLASVYRNLDVLEEFGLVRHVHLGHGPGPYSLAATEAVEFVTCERCGAFEAVEPHRLDAVRAVIERELGYAARFTHFPIVGLCPACQPPQRGLAMHIPDGFLHHRGRARVRGAGGGRVGVGLRRANVDLDERRVPLLGVTAAFVFAAQMLNFPVAGGTSGHFLGAALAAILLGPGSPAW